MARQIDTKEKIDNNFLKEDQEVYVNEKVVVAREVPKMEEIIFFNNRDPGTTLEFHYASKTHPLKLYKLVHGQRYSLPLEVIHHLEGMAENDPYACHKRLYSERRNLEGLPESYISGYSSYFQCKRCR